MRKPIAVGIAAALVVAVVVPAFAESETVTGRLVDKGCYLMDPEANAGADHGDNEGCAAACAAKGMPVAVLTEDGELVTVAGELAADNNAMLVPHMGHVVEITGEVTTVDDESTITAAELTHISSE